MQAASREAEKTQNSPVENFKHFKKKWKKCLTKGKQCANINKLRWAVKTTMKRSKTRWKSPSAPCKLNNVNMNKKHLGQFLIKLFLSQTKLFECENSQRISWVIAKSKYLIIDFKNFGSFNTIYWEFDPGSGRTLAACLTHASRTEFIGLRLRPNEFELSGERVSNAWATCLSEGDNSWKRLLIPHNTSRGHPFDVKDLSLKDGLASD